MVKLIKIQSNEGEDFTGEIFVDDVQNAELYQQEGFHHLPEADTDGVLLYVGRGESHGIVICPKKREALSDSPGNTVIYSISGGSIKSKITLDTSGNVIVDAPGTIKLGTAAAESIVKGNIYTTAESTFLTALTTYVNGIKAIADPSDNFTSTFVTAISAFATAISGSLSTKSFTE